MERAGPRAGASAADRPRNAERFVARFGHEFKWTEGEGWLYWDGKRWSRDAANGKLLKASHVTMRAIQNEADAVRASGDDFIVKEPKSGPAVFWSDVIAKWGRDSESNSRMSKLREHAAPDCEVDVQALDADPYKINVLNGTLVLNKDTDGEYIKLRPHDPADLITHLAPVEYDPLAACPAYDRFLERVMPKEENRRFLHQWGGLSLTGDVSEQILAFFYGTGKNGKSTLLNAWARVMGDYGKSIDISTFLNESRTRAGGQPTPDLARLTGVRFLRTSEPEKGAKLAEGLVKLATGGEPMLVRHLNQPFFEFLPQFKLTISGNYKPVIQGADEGIWRRVRLIPWLVQIPEAERDKHLGVKLERETQGIFNRLLDGLRDWADEGLVEPEEVTEATRAYREESDPLGRFLSACVDPSPGERVQSSVMFETFKAWGKVNDGPEWSNKGFSAAMSDRGFAKKQSDVIWWLNVRLKRRADDFVDIHGNPRPASVIDEIVGDDPAGRRIDLPILP
ncbi:hypothetical protein A7A08_01860 [Methyloligella halotolerans]|uniref:SF3 helicase domain-containing protein n=1 Tax=Methyloligella halotolerans TaxID=1177755 RepID=A0A1E2RY12_9HYPH|nr:DNA primase family protein [Methyloligella halotolerans]ODA67114.1 hypothetical protein A7A08_01860 [Methyloligella halotolerans]